MVDLIKKETLSQKMGVVKSRDFAELKVALDDSSDKNRNLLIAFLLIEMYIFSSILSTGHEQLLLIDNQQSIALLTFKIPLEIFFWLAPIVLFSFHFNLLFNLQQHTKKLTAWLSHEKHNKSSHYILLKPYIINIWIKDRQTKLTAPRLDRMLVHIIVSFVCFTAPILVLFVIQWRVAALQDALLTGWHTLWLGINIFTLVHYRQAVFSNKNHSVSTGDASLFMAIGSSIATSPLILLVIFLSTTRFTLLWMILDITGIEQSFIKDKNSPTEIRYWLKHSHLQYAVPRLIVTGIQLNAKSTVGPKFILSSADNGSDRTTRMTVIRECEPGVKSNLVSLKQRHFAFVDLSNAILCYVDLSHSQMIGATLDGATISGNFNMVTLKFANLQQTQIQRDSQMIGTDFGSANLSYTIANHSSFTKANFSNAKIISSEFAASNFEQANFTGAQIIVSDFRRANLIGARLKMAHLEHNDLSGADLRYINDMDTVLLKSNVIQHCLFDEDTLIEQTNMFVYDNCLIVDKQDEGYIGSIKDRTLISGLNSYYNRFDSLKHDAYNKSTTDLSDTVDRLIAATALSRSDVISLNNFRLSQIPAKLFALKHLTEIDFANNRLDANQLDLLFTQMPNIEELILSANQLSELPASIDNLTNLKMLIIDNNKLRKLPDTMTGLTNLYWLEANENELESLPEQIGKLKRLEWLDVGANRLSNVPLSAQALDGLQMFTLKDNRLTARPPHLNHLRSVIILE